MKLNYFSLLCFIWALVGICSRVVIKKLGAGWKDWEENKAYTSKRPKWLIAADILAISLIIFTWYMVLVSDVRGAWIIASLFSLVLLKAVLQLFRYDQFVSFVKKVLHDDLLFSRINLGVLILSVCLIGLGIFYSI